MSAKVYVVVAADEADEHGNPVDTHVHAVFFSKVSAESDARRYNEMHRAKGSDAWAYVDEREVRP